MADLTVQEVNNIIKEWCQRDCILGDYYFLFGYNPQLILNELLSDEQQTGESDIEFVQEKVLGFVVVTQTCDIVRGCESKPYVEISPLCEMPSDQIGNIKNHLVPSYTLIPALEDRKIVADLNRTMTVEKPILATWNKNKIRGCRDDKETVSFSWALGRKRSRFAFPNKFIEVFNPFLIRVKEKHDKNTDEGRMLTEFKEMRVRAAPDWSSQNCSITFFFLVDKENSNFTDWSAQIEAWKGLIQLKNTQFSETEMLVVDYDEISAREYKESMPLDLEGLSVGAG